MGKISQYDLSLASLPEGRFVQDFKCDTSLFRMMENEDVTAACVDVRMTVDYRNGSYEVTFSCHGSLAVPCDRCLDDVEVPVDTEYRMTVRYGEDYDDSRDDLLVLPQSQTHLDVAPIVYTTLALCIPLHKVHAEGECNPEMMARLGEHTVGAVDDGEEQENNSID